jgi:hypothetical protein
LEAYIRGEKSCKGALSNVRKNVAGKTRALPKNFKSIARQTAGLFNSSESVAVVHRAVRHSV